MKPILNQILFKPFLEEEKTEGGIFVPDSFRNESDKGTVIAVGNGSKNRPMTLKKGDIVFRVHKWGIAVEENGEKLYLMDDSAILAKM